MAATLLWKTLKKKTKLIENAKTYGHRKRKDVQTLKKYKIEKGNKDESVIKNSENGNTK